MQKSTLACLLTFVLWSSVSEACELYRDETRNTTGTPIASATVAITLAGTLIPVTVYNGPDCAVSLGTSVTSDSGGIFEFYIHDGKYDFTTTRTGYSFGQVQNVTIFSHILEYVIPLATYTTTDIAAASTGAIAQISSTVATLVINQAATATLSFTCPSTMTLRFEGQGTLTLSAGKTATMNCRVLNLTEHPVLLGSGTYTLSATAMGARLDSVTFAQLDAATNGTLVYCSDCVVANPCVGSGTGASALRRNSIWVCDATTAPTDIVQFYPAVTFCHASDANPSLLTPIRVAEGDEGLRRTSGGAETYNIVCHLPMPTRTTAGKGYKLTGFKIAQQIVTQALTSNTFNGLNTTTYVNNVANAVAAYGGSITITMPTATQANPYLTAGTVGTPAFMNTSDAQITLDFTVVMQNLGVYTLYGVSAIWTEQD